MPAVQLGGEFMGFDLPSTIATAEPIDSGNYTVQPGDTLWDIVERHYGHVDSELLSNVLAANPDIRDPNVILVGWTLVLPGPVAHETEPWTEPAPVEVPAALHRRLRSNRVGLSSTLSTATRWGHHRSPLRRCHGRSLFGRRWLPILRSTTRT